jgi:transcriptional regulator with XRE-family HTH domain
MSLGKKIISLRQQKNWKQRDLAARLGVTARQLVRWELDQVRPRPNTIELLAQTLGVSAEELIAEAPVTSLEQVEDLELRELLRHVPDLDQPRLEALKLVLRDIISCHQFTRFSSPPKPRIAAQAS